MDTNACRGKNFKETNIRLGCKYCEVELWDGNKESQLVEEGKIWGTFD
jgi:hypothetical protein